MRRPASLCMHTVAREAHGRHRPSAATGGSCERSNATSKGTAHGGKRRKNVRFEPKPMIAFKNISYTPILHLRRGERKRTSRWPAAVERREASVPRRADGESLPARGRAGQRYWSTHNTGCRCTRAPFGAPLPSFARGKDANLGDLMPRENDDACAEIVARIGLCASFGLRPDHIRVSVRKSARRACDTSRCRGVHRIDFMEMVPLAGLEPARCRHQQILSLPRLPIPPQGHIGREYSGDPRGVNRRRRPAWRKAPTRSR
jgi:hypothetical protein